VFYSLSLRITDITASCDWTDRLFFLVWKRRKGGEEGRGKEKGREMIEGEVGERDGRVKVREKDG
jgi:hypothetical protein